MTWPERLKNHSTNLSRTEKTLVDYITKNPHESAFLKQNELCELSGVSKPLVISCFRKLGYGEYRDFQEGIREFYASQIDSYQASTVALRDMTSTDQLIRTALEIEHNTLKSLEESAAAYGEELADSLLAARRIFLFCDGTGFYPGHYLWQRLRSCGLEAILTGMDRNHSLEEMGTLGEEDLFLTFSYSADRDYLYGMMDFVKKRGCPSWIITGFMDHLLAQKADRLIHVPRGQWDFKNSMAGPMIYAQLILLAVEYRGKERIQKHLKNMEEIRKDLL
ncbi:MAG: MurR/RpiR family transcriptional regulator [Spirochaetales bacterium]|nr:MurR/RpiR family transcriptional regulator [Spirochaetales bacterium]